MVTDFDIELAERREKSDARLWTALMEHADAYQLSRDDELLNNFAIVCHWTREKNDGRSRYTTHFHVPEVPYHIAEGLFATGLRIVQSGDPNEDEEE